MSLDDFEVYDSNGVELSTDRFSEGNASLRFNYEKTDALYGGLILKNSMTDSPTEVQVIADIYHASKPGLGGAAMITRFQGRGSFYLLTYNASNELLEFSKAINGQRTIIEKFRDLTSLVADEFVRVKYQFFVDQNEDVRARVFRDKNGNGSFTKVAQDMVDPDPSFSDGGGVGITSSQGLSSTGIDLGKANFDDVEFYY